METVVSGPVGVRNMRSYNNNNNPLSEFEVPVSGPRFSSDYEVPLSGQKLLFDFLSRGGSPIERFGGGVFEKRSFDGDGYDKRQGDGVPLVSPLKLHHGRTYKEVLRSQVEHILNDRLLQFVNIDMLDVKVNCVPTHVSLFGCLFT
ncbi:hypothetical protein Hanom_Chr04g00295441 [Helianthus anomalus]